MIKKKEKDGTIVYEADSELRDSENVPLQENIDVYFEREVPPMCTMPGLTTAKQRLATKFLLRSIFINTSPYVGWMKLRSICGQWKKK